MGHHLNEKARIARLAQALGYGLPPKDAIKFATPYTQRVTNVNMGGLAVVLAGALALYAWWLHNRPEQPVPPTTPPVVDTDTNTRYRLKVIGED